MPVDGSKTEAEDFEKNNGGSRPDDAAGDVGSEKHQQPGGSEIVAVSNSVLASQQQERESPVPQATPVAPASIEPEATEGSSRQPSMAVQEDVEMNELVAEDQQSATDDAPQREEETGGEMESEDVEEELTQKVDNTVLKTNIPRPASPVHETKPKGDVAEAAIFNDTPSQEPVEIVEHPTPLVEEDVDKPETVEAYQTVGIVEKEMSEETGDSEMSQEEDLVEKSSAVKIEESEGEQEEDELASSSPVRAPAPAVSRSCSFQEPISPEKEQLPALVPDPFTEEDAAERVKPVPVDAADEEGHEYRLSLGYDEIAMKLAEGASSSLRPRNKLEDVLRKPVVPCRAPDIATETEPTFPLPQDDPWHLSPHQRVPVAQSAS